MEQWRFGAPLKRKNENAAFKNKEERNGTTNTSPFNFS
jgi:hypothetical protein